MEGCMSEGYSMQDAMGVCVEFKRYFRNVNWHVWDDDKDERLASELL